MMRRWMGAAAAVLLGMASLPCAQAAIEATEGWSRQTVPGVNVAVGYMVLKNTGTQRRELLKITSPLADFVDLHQTSIDAQGVSHMWPIGRLELDPGEVMRFTPNGRHMMLRGLTTPLRAGMQVPVTLVFEDELPVTVMLEVRPLVDEAAHDHEHMHH